MRRNVFARLLIVVWVVLLLAACGDNGSGPAVTATPSASPSETSQPTATSATATATARATETPSSPSTPTSEPATNTPIPPVAPPASVIRRGETLRREVVFTFDAGSDAGFTSQILNTLAANRIVAAFGMTGRWAEENPPLVRRIVNEGHELINHSYDHASFTGLSTGLPPLTRAQRWQQLDRTEQIVRNIAGASTKPYFRPPYGDYDASVNVDVGARGYRYNVMWTVDSGGWRGISAQAITQRCLTLAVPGAIYVFHVGSASQDAAALQSIIDGLRAEGYSFVPLSRFAP